MSKQNTYKNNDTTIWFKSTKANGYAFLSNFWPDVTLRYSSPFKTCYSVGPLVGNPPASTTSLHSFEIHGKTYRTVEHRYQAAKFEEINEKAFNEIVSAKTAVESKKLATKFAKSKTFDKEKWETCKEFVMEEALFAKFSQNPELRVALLDTDSKILREIPGRTVSVWTGGNKQGEKNLLGELLMKVRTELHKHNKKK